MAARSIVSAHSVFVDVVGDGRAQVEGRAVGAEEDLIAGVGNAYAVNFQAQQSGEGAARHWVDADGNVVQDSAIGDVVDDFNRLVQRQGRS